MNYNQDPYYSATPYYSGQVVLNEFDNTIDVFMEHTQTTNTSACGLENPTGTLGTAAPGRNSGIWAATNEAWKFTPTALTYAWTPAGTLSNAALSNPVATPATTTPYAVMVTSNAGCIANGAVTVNVVTSCDDGNVCTLDACLNGVCSHTFQDMDGDGTCDANDGCPNDPLKIAPGICGCGVSDVDSDGDGTVNCLDGCPADPLKIAPGICGCGVSDADTDGDGTVDCNDGCPADPLKIAPGQCGCGIADTDSDGAP